MPSVKIKASIRQAREQDIPALYALYNHIGKKDVGYFEVLFEKNCVVLIAEHEKQLVGFGVLNFEPKYSLYKRLNIPEIQDLNVISEMRQQGIATDIIKRFEEIAKDQGLEHVGISVALTKEFGPAQRLYAKLGYIPDGNGVTYDRQPVEGGQAYYVDDDLCLMMVKAVN